MKKLLLVLFLFGISVHTLQAQSALQTLASSMQPGWAELQTTGAVAAFTGTGGSVGVIDPYATTFNWDPVTHCGYYIGADHGGAPTPGATAAYRFVRYCAATNAWTVMDTPPWAHVDATGYTDSHGYDRTSINVTGRKLIRSPGGGDIRLWDLDSGVSNATTWTSLQQPFGGVYNFGVYGSEYFPDRNSLIYPWASGGLMEYSFTTATWTQITSYDEYIGGSTWWQVIYNPVRHEMLFIETPNTGALSTWKMGVLSSSGVFTRIGDIPMMYRTYDGSGINGEWVVAPDGKYLLMTDPTNGTGRNVYEFDPSTNTYALLANQVPNKHLSNRTNWISGTIAEYGVTMWIWADGGSNAGVGAGVYLYKSGNGSPPDAPINAPPSVNAGPDISVVLPSSANLSGTVTDDGLPNGILTRVWTGPSGVTFANPTTANATASFPAAGSYTLTLIGNDGALSSSDTLVVTVGAQPSPKLTIPFDTTSQGSDGKSYRIQGTAVEQ